MLCSIWSVLARDTRTGSCSLRSHDLISPHSFCWPPRCLLLSISWLKLNKYAVRKGNPIHNTLLERELFLDLADRNYVGREIQQVFKQEAIFIDSNQFTPWIYRTSRCTVQLLLPEQNTSSVWADYALWPDQTAWVWTRHRDQPL